MRPKAYAIIATLVLLALPTSASAHKKHHQHYSPIQAAYGIAARYWGAQPCDGDVTIRREVPPAAMIVPQFSQPQMWASWNSGTPTENSESAPQPFSGCVVAINPEAWPTERFEAYTAWPEFAVQMIHEVGHLLGHEHSADPTSVMFSGPLSAKPWVAGEYAPGWS